MVDGFRRRDVLAQRFADRMDKRDDERRLRSGRIDERLTAGMHTCIYLGGAGLPLQAKATYRFGVAEDHLAWCTPDGVIAYGVPFTDLLDASTAGAGEVTTSGGFVGGGVGLEGAATGIAAAAVLNALTQRTRVDSLLRVTTRTAEGLFAFTATGPQQIFLELAPFRVQRRQQDPSLVSPAIGHSSPGPVDLISSLERLAALRERGLLSEEEFRAQKEALLRST